MKKVKLDILGLSSSVDSQTGSFALVLKENKRILEDRYELTLLDYSILTSPKKLMEYQQFYFKDKFVQKKLENLNTIEILNEKLKIDKMVKIDE